MKKLYLVCVLISCLFYSTNTFAQSASIMCPLTNLKKRIKNMAGLPSFVSLFLLTFLFGSIAHAQWTSTNLSSGNINTVFYNNGALISGD